MYRGLISAMMTLIMVVTPAACGFQPAGFGPNTSGDDAPVDDNTNNPCMQACAWGCVVTPTPHCGTLVPGGGAAVPGDLSGTTDATIGSSIDTGDGNNMMPKL